MKKTEKEFDCVAMKRAGAARVYETTKDMTPEEELAFWRQKDVEMAQKYPEMRVLRAPEAERE